MNKTKRIVSMMLCCIMLFGMTLSANAASFPYNKGPCPYCGYGNSGEFEGTIGCLKCLRTGAQYKCGHCQKVFYYCDLDGIYTSRY